MSLRPLVSSWHARFRRAEAATAEVEAAARHIGGSGSSGGGSHDRGGGGGGFSHSSGSQGHGDGGLGRGSHGGGSTGSGGSGAGSHGTGGNSGNGRGNSGGSSSGGSDGWFGRGAPTTISGPGSQNNDSGFDLGRKSSRSGSVNYRGSNNVSTTRKVPGSVAIGRAPSVRNLNKGDLIGRKDHPVLIRNGFRTGYYFYTPLWCDDYFWYPFYLFEPWGEQCCISPWYYYPMLPPYVAYDRCRFDHYPGWGVWAGYPYNWSRPAYYGNYDYWGSGHGSAIDYAVDDIVNAFEHQDKRSAGRLISNQDDVAIYVDGKYSYTINAKDFYDMFLDATQNTKTKHYEILSVETGKNDTGGDCVRVTARHDYEDPWGAVTSVEHFYELRYDGPSLVISKFGVSGGKTSD